ncbi:MAG: hypothetical protein ACK4MF_03010 [Hyphomicrobiaceae bacterium]
MYVRTTIHALSALVACFAISAAAAVAAEGTTGGPAAAAAANPDWPCVQHKQAVLTAAQMWDGPQIAVEGQFSGDADIRRLVQIATTRRIPMADVEAEIKTFAAALPADQRDAKLAELFSAVLAEINRQRNSIMNGIERFQRQQVLRGKKLEEEGIALAELQRKAAADAALESKVGDAQLRYDWDARVFQERQQNIPIACEIPVLVEARAFELAQTIRNLMTN